MDKKSSSFPGLVIIIERYKIYLGQDFAPTMQTDLVSLSDVHLSQS